MLNSTIRQESWISWVLSDDRRLYIKFRFSIHHFPRFFWWFLLYFVGWIKSFPLKLPIPSLFPRKTFSVLFHSDFMSKGLVALKNLRRSSLTVHLFICFGLISSSSLCLFFGLKLLRFFFLLAVERFTMEIFFPSNFISISCGRIGALWRVLFE